MKKLNEKQKKILIIGVGGLLTAYLLYRWYSNRGAATTTTAGQTAPDTSGADYAQLAGQEQGDVAALQGQNQQLAAQEQADIAGLTGQESGDIAMLQAEILKLISGVGDAQSAAAKAQREAAAAASGAKKVQRGKTVTTHQGGAFYDWYVRATGHPPPKTVSVNNWLYEAWKAGVKAAALRPHKSQHPSTNNPHVAHPNPWHKQQGWPNRQRAHPYKPPHRTTRPSGSRG